MESRLEQIEDEIITSTFSIYAFFHKIYPKSDGDCYVNGFQGEDVIINEKPGETIELIEEAMRTTSSELENMEMHITQACYWPGTPDGLPCIGPVHGIFYYQ